MFEMLAIELGMKIARALGTASSAAGERAVGDPLQGPPPEVRLVERGREEERLGDDPPVRYDNRSSTLEQHYTLTASREWRHEVKIDREHLRAQQITGGGSLSIPHLTLKLERALSSSLKDAYSLTAGRTEQFEQSIDLRVPARTLVLVTLQWKRIWQIGEVQIETPEGLVGAPFRSLAGVAFDVHTETRPADPTPTEQLIVKPSNSSASPADPA